jgi:N-acetylmuramoyl-L-alanine amidase
MFIAISSGHGLKIRGASGVLDEVDEARRVVETVADLLLKSGVGVQTFHDDISTTQQENLETIVTFHNSVERDLDVSVHFNAYEDTSKPMGVECLYVTQSELADDISSNIAEASGLFDRGPKYRSDLYFLNNCEKPAVLIETCFVDSSADADLYNAHFDAICKAIAETISGTAVQEPVEPVEPPPKVDVPLSGDNRVDIIGATFGDVSVIINGKLINRTMRGYNTVVLDIRMTGDVTLSINGQDFHNANDAIPKHQTEIIATVFGGESDKNYSAYGPYDSNGNGRLLNDTDLYVALPDRIEDERPNVRVINRITGLTAIASIEDVGPWNTDDPYWETCTRPAAESGTDEKGRETNGAGIDLSPALAATLGIDGMGKVDWDFVD